ncbi:GPW/gp25 family protein [Polymorphum gilvum]|uniref:Phage-related baseplate assembly protein n=1 Tax=Polymorphum gilvum (strain LMG 25793 / CGMCC 1.9160 / SL003B-26A1) TaxID=991905 RepID=F2J638_POLGS|nr:GPW/gp25 family protein [Polymorphum gilvum]ADZ72402.1 Phage-related baseplate assembly protein [Polymorphum gilvum SL003B-26A1]
MRTGISATTGKVLTGWDHCVQSLGKILTTRFNSRVMRRDFGSRIPDLQDANANERTLLELYVAIAEAVEDPVNGEPGFRLRTIDLAAGGRAGRFVFILDGYFYPRGHLGDYALREARVADLAVGSGERLVLEPVS